MNRLMLAAGAAITAAAAWFFPIFHYSGVLREVEVYARVSLLAAGILLLLVLPGGRWRGSLWIFFSITGALGELFVTYGVYRVVTGAVPGVKFGPLQPSPGLAALLTGYAVCLLAGIRDLSVPRRRAGGERQRRGFQPVQNLFAGSLAFMGRQAASGAVYEVYSAADAESARAFLSTRRVLRPGYAVVVETPEGNWGLDAGGLYLESLQDWQFDLALAECDGECELLDDNRIHGLGDTLAVRVRCGNCGRIWLDGAQTGYESVARCPTCQAFNRIWLE